MENHIEILNKRLLASLGSNYPVGLTHGKMGLVVYYYCLSKNKEDIEYRAIAEKILEQIIHNVLSLNHPITVENGLASIGLGLINLVNEQFVEGDLNKLLDDIDNIIFHKLVFYQENKTVYTSVELLHLLYYLYFRLINQTEKNNNYLFRELIVKVLNVFTIGLKEDFYNDRIYKILEEFEPKILSRFPVFHTNRLYLLCGMLPLIPYMQKKHKGKMNSLYTLKDIIGAVGGAVFIKTEKYLNSGMDSEDFYGWGLEDGEKHYRWLELIIGYTVIETACFICRTHETQMECFVRKIINIEQFMTLMRL